MFDNDALLEQDRDHLLHPLHHPQFHGTPVIFERGEGIWLHTVDGRKLIDGFAGLWNVNIGHGQKEMAATAAQQIETLAYCSNYAGSANVPAIQLADKLAGMAYPTLNTTFFASGGAEANESAFKTVRHYWKRLGKPDKTKIIARTHAYHGITLAAMSATGLNAYWPMFEPRVPGFSHIPAPYAYRFQGDIKEGETLGQAAARALEEAILREGPDTVGGFIAEPIQGTGGVIVPPDDYFPLIREICDRYNVLLIADEVITGFGRTGEWFGLNRWGIQPDIMSFAKGITSGYLPLGATMVSDEIAAAISNTGYFAHGFTYSGHPTTAAAALANLDLLEKDRLIPRVRDETGSYFQRKLREFGSHPAVGEVRGCGLIGALELLPRGGKAALTPTNPLGAKAARIAREEGVIVRGIRDLIALSPPLIITTDEIDYLMAAVGRTLDRLRSPE